MSVLLWVIGATFLVSLISFIGIVTLSLKRDFLMKTLLVLVAFAAGSLLGVAVFDLIPEALEAGGASASLFIVIGILIFFAVERFVGWHHTHKEHDTDIKGHHMDKEHDKYHHKPYIYTNLIAEAIHNFIDGLLIAASFLVNIPLGIAATVAVALHEIPQEIGDFAILIHGGLKVKQALLYNFIAAITAVVGGVLGIYLVGLESSLNPVLLGIAGGGFLYLALVDLVPEINKEKDWKNSSAQFIFLVIGILVIYGLTILLPHT